MKERKCPCSAIQALLCLLEESSSIKPNFYLFGDPDVHPRPSLAIKKWASSKISPFQVDFYSPSSFHGIFPSFSFSDFKLKQAWNLCSVRANGKIPTYLDHPIISCHIFCPSFTAIKASLLLQLTGLFPDSGIPSMMIKGFKFGVILERKVPLEQSQSFWLGD